MVQHQEGRFHLQKRVPSLMNYNISKRYIIKRKIILQLKSEILFSSKKIIMNDML